jgi:hypothetical protein
MWALLLWSVFCPNLSREVLTTCTKSSEIVSEGCSTQPQSQDQDENVIVSLLQQNIELRSNTQAGAIEQSNEETLFSEPDQEPGSAGGREPGTAAAAEVPIEVKLSEEPPAADLPVEVKESGEPPAAEVPVEVKEVGEPPAADLPVSVKSSLLSKEPPAAEVPIEVKLGEEPPAADLPVEVKESGEPPAAEVPVETRRGRGRRSPVKGKDKEAGELQDKEVKSSLLSKEPPAAEPGSH